MENFELYLRAELYQREVKIGDINPALNIFRPLFKQLNPDKDSIESLIGRIKGVKISADDPRAPIVYIFLETLNSILESPSPHQKSNEFIDVERDLYRYSELAFDHFSALGIDFNKPAIFVVDDYPAPFSGSGLVAITMDESDKKAFGIEPGIYFKKAFLRPFVSIMMLFHEYIHVVMTRNKEDVFSGYLEEGIAVLYGELYLFSEYVDSNIAKTAFIFNRTSSFKIPQVDIYLDHFRNSYALALRIGINGIEDILRSTRSHLKSLERDLWNGNLQHKKTITRRDASMQLFEECALLTSKEYFATPAAVWVAKFAHQGLTVSEIANRSCLSAEIVDAALNELSGIPRWIIRKGDRIVQSDVEVLTSPLQLRARVESGTAPLEP